MLERRKPLDLVLPLKGNASTKSGRFEREQLTPLERLRTGVQLATEAVKAVSQTAMEALRESAQFIGLFGDNLELVDPFAHLEAPIWSEKPRPNFSAWPTPTVRS